MRPPADNKLRGKRLLVRRHIPIIFISITIHFGGSLFINNFSSGSFRGQHRATRKREFTSFTSEDFISFSCRIKNKPESKFGVVKKRCLHANHHVMLSAGARLNLFQTKILNGPSALTHWL